MKESVPRDRIELSTHGFSVQSPTCPKDGPFWRLIDQTAGPASCWPWTGFLDKDGYGTHTKGRRANRVACEAGHGPPPFKGAKALHSCDNPTCCNPAHLSWGTQKRNYDESVERGHHINARPRRERGYFAKITEEQARAIIAGGEAQNFEATGKLYGISGKAVALIVRGKRWAHLSACSTQAGRTQKPNTYRPRRRLIARLRKAVLAGRMSLEQADAALVRR